jgi:hypothetical protein
MGLPRKGRPSRREFEPESDHEEGPEGETPEREGVIQGDQVRRERHQHQRQARRASPVERDGRRHQRHDPGVSADVEQEVLGGVRPEGLYGYYGGPLSEYTRLGTAGEEAGGDTRYGSPAS